MRRFAIPLSLLLTASSWSVPALTVAQDPAPTPVTRASLCCGSAMSTNFEVHACHVHVVVGEDTLAFGTYRAPDGTVRCSYVLLVPEAVGVWSGVESTTNVDPCGPDGGGARATATVKFGDLAYSFEHRLGIDSQGKSFTTESLTVDGQSVDPAAGRVFVVRGGALRQVECALPALPADPHVDHREFLTKAAAVLREALRADPVHRDE